MIDHRGVLPIGGFETASWGSSKHCQGARTVQNRILH